MYFPGALRRRDRGDAASVTGIVHFGIGLQLISQDKKWFEPVFPFDNEAAGALLIKLTKCFHNINDKAFRYLPRDLRCGRRIKLPAGCLPWQLCVPRQG